MKGGCFIGLIVVFFGLGLVGYGLPECWSLRRLPGTNTYGLYPEYAPWLAMLLEERRDRQARVMEQDKAVERQPTATLRKFPLCKEQQTVCSTCEQETGRVAQRRQALKIG